MAVMLPLIAAYIMAHPSNIRLVACSPCFARLMAMQNLPKMLGWPVSNHVPNHIHRVGTQIAFPTPSESPNQRYA
jgi:hypothetical protein